MRNFKNNFRRNTNIKFFISENMATQIIRVLTFLMLGVVFLLLSTYFILGNEHNETIQPFNFNEREVISQNNEQNTKKVSELNINVDNVRVFLTKENKVVDIPFEEYIKGVVSSEMPISFEKEALKAQAICARTYTVAHLKSMGGGCSNGNGADLCDTTHCQVYMNKEKRLELWGENAKDNWNKIEEVIKETEGQVMAYDGQLAKGAYYFSTSGGKTENSEDIFTTELPYLRSVISTGEEEAPRYKSNLRISYGELIDKANKEYEANMTTNNIKNQIKILSRTEGGSVKEIKLGNVTISGPKFRKLYGLNSANFQIKFLDNELEINCLGYGHGVGMSQWGANAMAKEGKQYKDIITHYYRGVTITNINK